VPIKKIGAIAVATAALGLTAGIAGPASASARPAALTSCLLLWHDNITAGIKCTGAPFIGRALCNNGHLVYGQEAASGQTSYAYCNSINSTLHILVIWGASQA
jgi:hypothetical protein